VAANCTAANLANGGIGNDFAPLFIMTDVERWRELPQLDQWYRRLRC
jgi:hypothetical protein